ncbi:MAG: thioredoxin-disulfide reductase [Candidatus Micrarchaeota archaeon]|nr:thioredoxin-disulfide reductase [Candidatus Micrarchaeota archaeon]MDE1848121.1 thioredoxin-disulfide reductase [Candidatus Micrarchaeota archaeon]MDE1863928.1 thioredoxin-disulfide reductase [Candidatus Micrarchaeota archaeon]
MVENVIIIGSGPAGLSAALYTSREGFNPLLIRGVSSGGQLLLTTDVENYPGYEKIAGPELIRLMEAQAIKFGTRFVEGDITKVELGSKPIKVYVNDTVYETLSLIISTGASSKWIGLPSEKNFTGRGVSSCATCDGAFFKNKEVVVVGGGDTAMEDSLFLTRFASNVTIVHRRDAFRASKIMQQRVFANPKIKVLWDTAVEEITGDKKVTGVKLKNLKTNNIAEMKIDGVFVAIGHQPNSSLFAGQLKLDDQGYIITKDDVLTDIEGVYVAGDVADRFYKQAVTAAGAGVKAALRVREYLSMLKFEEDQKAKL